MKVSDKWQIEDKQHILAYGSATRRMVSDYGKLAGIKQPEAIRDLIAAGYEALTGQELPSRDFGGPNPPSQRRVGNEDSRKADEESGTDR